MIGFPDSIREEEAALRWWEEEFATKCESLGVQANAANLVRAVVRSLRNVRTAESDKLLTLPEAAIRTGYSPDHIGRLIREGKLDNAGRKNAPRVRAADLVRQLKPKLAAASARSYDPLTDARSLRSRREEKPNGDSRTETF